jgi:hypothetical protein
VKLHSFDPNISYRFRTLAELNALSNTINECKSKLSMPLQYYLQKYSQILDEPRLSKALAVPGELAENFIKAGTPQKLQKQVTISSYNKPNNPNSSRIFSFEK